MSMFQEASAAELIRASQKDEFFMQSIRSQLLDILSEIFGSYSVRYENEIDLMAKLLYFIPTTLFNNATLGEEYCSIKPITNGYPYKLCTPSILRRILLITVSVCVPYLYNKIRKTGRTQRINESWSNTKKYYYKLWNLLLKILLKCDKFISFILKFHLCYFYFNSKFYELSKYIVGISYIYTGSPKNNNARNISYSGLGRLLIIQFIISVIIVLLQVFEYIRKILSNKKKRQYILSQLRPTNIIKKSNFHLLFKKNFDENSNEIVDITVKNENKNDDNDDKNSNDDTNSNHSGHSNSKSADINNDDNDNDDDNKSDLENDSEVDDITILSELGLEYQSDNEYLDDNTPECVLCLSTRRYPTATECGHIFCWNCIADWCTTKPQCPLCKSQILHQKLVRLANFR